MRMNKVFIVLLILLTGCLSGCYYYFFIGKNIEVKHTVSSKLRFYQADLDHDGVIGENEKNLTWKESYDVLIKQSSDPVQLKKFADNMKISKKLSDEERITLARNEILHQAEDLLLSTGCIVPIYNGTHVFLQKDFLKGVEHNIYRDAIFDNAYCDNQKDEISVCVGTEPSTLDSALCGQVQSATIIENSLRGVLFYPNDREWRNELGIVIKSFDENTKNVVLDIYIGNFKLKNKKDGSKLEDYEFNDFVRWDDGKEIEEDDLIWAINRVSSPVTGSSFRFFTSGICGYEEFEKSELERIKKKGEINKTYSFYNGLKGVKKTTGIKKASDFGSNKEGAIPSVRVTIKSDGDSKIFLEGLKNLSLSFSPRHRMTKNTGKEEETIVNDWWQYTSNNKKDGQYYYCCCGPFKAEKIEHQKNGKIVLVKNDYYHNKDKIKINKLTFNFFSSEDAAETAFKNNNLDFNSFFSKSKIKVNEKGEPLNENLNKVSLPLSNYLFFNVNDDSLDSIVHEEDDEITAEIKRQKLRYIFSLLIDRNYISDIIEKGFSIPSRGVVSGKIYEKYVPKKDGDEITIDKDKEKVEWCSNNGYVEGKYNRFEERGKENEDDLFKVYTGSKSDADYIEKVKKLKEENIKKAMEIADEINLKYEYNNNSLRFINFPVITITYSNQLDVFRHIQDYFKKFGISLTLNKREFNFVCAAMDSGNGALFNSGYSADFDDPLTFLTLFTSDNSNFCQLGKDTLHKSYNKRIGGAVKGLKSKITK